MPGDSTGPILVTGANGHIGRRLLASLAEASAEGTGCSARARAVVRSQRAAGTLERLAPELRPEIHVIDYGNAEELQTALAGCSAHS